MAARTRGSRHQQRCRRGDDHGDRPDDCFNLFHGGAKELAAAMLSQAVIGALLWVKTHPVPIDEEEPARFV